MHRVWDYVVASVFGMNSVENYRCKGERRRYVCIVIISRDMT